MSKVKDSTYFVVQSWMVTKLNLRTVERDVYAIIYGYSQDGESEFHGSLSYLAELTGYSKQSICKALKSLTEHNLILKEELDISGVKICKYKTNLAYTNFNGSKASLIPSKASLTNNIVNNNIDNNSKELLEENFESQTIIQDCNSFLGSANKPKKKESLYNQCIAMINNFVQEHNAGNNISKLLVQYLNLRLEMKDKPMYANQWKGLLNKLEEVHKQGFGYEPVIKYSIEHGYASFYSLPNAKPKTDNNVTSEHYTEEELQQLAKHSKELEKKGKKAFF